MCPDKLTPVIVSVLPLQLATDLRWSVHPDTVLTGTLVQGNRASMVCSFSVHSAGEQLNLASNAIRTCSCNLGLQKSATNARLLPVIRARCPARANLGAKGFAAWSTQALAW